MIKPKSIREFAEAHGVTRQNIEQRLKVGCKFGMLDGEAVMYNPNNVMVIKDEFKKELGL